MWNLDFTLRRAGRGGNDLAIDRDTAERLLDGAPDPAHQHATLVALLAAAARPPQPHEIAGEQDALTTFAREYRPSATPRTAALRPGRGVGTAVAVSITALLLGGSAYAAGTGRLPEALRELLPVATAPTPTRSSPRSPTSPGSGRTTATPPSASAGPSPLPSTAPADATLVRLCRSWTAFRADPHAKPVTADDRRALALAAGGENAINGFCERLLGPTPEPSATTVKPGNPNPGSGKPSNPGKSR